MCVQTDISTAQGVNEEWLHLFLHLVVVNLAARFHLAMHLFGNRWR